MSKFAALLAKQVQLLQPSQKLMIYGAYGYTAELMLNLIRNNDNSLLPHLVLAGRSKDKLTAVIKDMQWQDVIKPNNVRCFAVDDSQKIDEHIKDVQVVLNCAGPFSQTAYTMIQACVRNGVSYLDITGEWKITEYALNSESPETKQLQQEADKKGISIIPASGYDSVPSDCLAKYVYEKYIEKYGNEDAPHLVEMAMVMGSNTSQGTAKTMVEGVASGIVTRKNRIIQGTPLMVKYFDFEMGAASSTSTTAASNTMVSKPCTITPWADISTAYYSTNGTPNVNVYFAQKSAPSPIFLAIFNFIITQWFLWLLFKIPGVLSLCKSMVDKYVPRTPNTSRGHEIVAVISNKKGDKKVEARLTVPNGYIITSETALIASLRVLSNQVKKHGCATPSQAFGSGFILEFENTSLKM